MVDTATSLIHQEIMSATSPSANLAHARQLVRECWQVLANILHTGIFLSRRISWIYTCVAHPFIRGFSDRSSSVGKCRQVLASIKQAIKKASVGVGQKSLSTDQYMLASTHTLLRWHTPISSILLHHTNVPFVLNITYTQVIGSLSNLLGTG